MGSDNTNGAGPNGAGPCDRPNRYHRDLESPTVPVGRRMSQHEGAVVSDPEYLTWQLDQRRWGAACGSTDAPWNGSSSETDGLPADCHDPAECRR